MGKGKFTLQGAVNIFGNWSEKTPVSFDVDYGNEDQLSLFYQKVSPEDPPSVTFFYEIFENNKSLRKGSLSCFSGFGWGIFQSESDHLLRIVVSVGDGGGVFRWVPLVKVFEILFVMLLTV